MHFKYLHFHSNSRIELRVKFANNSNIKHSLLAHTHTLTTYSIRFISSLFVQRELGHLFISSRQIRFVWENVNTFDIISLWCVFYSQHVRGNAWMFAELNLKWIPFTVQIEHGWSSLKLKTRIDNFVLFSYTVAIWKCAR